MRNLVLLAMTIMLCASCKPTTKGEGERHDRTLKQIATLKGTYPSFGALLDEDVGAGNKAWEEAQKVSGEEKLAEALKAANETLDSKLVSRLGEYSSKLEGVTSAYDRLPAKISSAANARVKSALAAKGEAMDIMANADVSSRESALKAVGDAIGKLITAKSALDDAKRIDKK